MGLVGNTTRQLTYPKKSPRLVGESLVSIHDLLILGFKFQFSKSIKSSTLHIFLGSISAALSCPQFKVNQFKKRSLSQNAQKFTQNHQRVVNDFGQRDLALVET